VAELRVQNQKLREALAMAHFRLSIETNAKHELADLLGQLSARVASSLSELVACKQEISKLTRDYSSLYKIYKTQLIGIWKLRNLLQQHEGRKVMPEPESTTPTAADNTSEPASPVRQLLPVLLGAAEPPSPVDDSSSSPASSTETEVQGSVAASPIVHDNSSPSTVTSTRLQRSHSATHRFSHSLPQLPDSLGLGDMPLARRLSSPLDSACSDAESGEDSSITLTPSKQQGSGCNTSELAMPARRWFPVLLEPTSVDRSSSSSSRCASPPPTGAQGTVTSSPLQRSHSVTHRFTRSQPQLPGTLGLDDMHFTRRLSSPLLGSAGSGAEDGNDSSITDTPSKQQGSGCSAESAPQSSESCSTSSPAFAANAMPSSGSGAHNGQASIVNHRLSPCHCLH
jgi:hypothetical protein